MNGRIWLMPLLLVPTLGMPQEKQSRLCSETPTELVWTHSSSPSASAEVIVSGPTKDNLGMDVYSIELTPDCLGTVSAMARDEGYGSASYDLNAPNGGIKIPPITPSKPDPQNGAILIVEVNNNEVCMKEDGNLTPPSRPSPWRPSAKAFDTFGFYCVQADIPQLTQIVQPKQKIRLVVRSWNKHAGSTEFLFKVIFTQSQ